MMSWMFLAFVVLLSSVYGQDECGDRCNAGQICLTNGTCVNRSELKHCGSIHYCQKEHDCCGLIYCMPAGSVCCGSGTYCKSGSTCCKFSCCSAGYHCNAGRCALDELSTQKNTVLTTRFVKTTLKPSTTRSTPKRTVLTTKFVQTTSKPLTTRSVKTTSKPSGTTFTTSSGLHFRWWYGVIIAVVVMTTIIAVAFIIRKYGVTRSNGNGGQRRSVPTHARQQHSTQMTYIMPPGSRGTTRELNISDLTQYHSKGGHSSDRRGTNTRKTVPAAMALTRF